MKVVSNKNKALKYAMRTWLLFLSISTLSTVNIAAQVSVSFRADSNKIMIGDPLKFKLVIQKPAKTTIEFPNFAGDTIAKLEIFEKGKIDTATINDKIVLSQTVTLSAYDSGTYHISAFPVFFVTEQKTTDSALSNEFDVFVSTLDVDTSKPIKPIKAPMDVPYVIQEFKWWILAALLLISALVAYLLYRKYRKKPAATDEKPRPKEPAHIWAINELTKLDNEKLWQSDQHKKFYSRLSDILRLYLEYRFDIYAMESTTDEIETLIADLKLKNEYRNRLLETLRLSDFAKFAKMTPMPDQNMRSMENAKAFVEHTKPNEQELLNQQTGEIK